MIRSNWACTASASGWSYTLCSSALTHGHDDFGVTLIRLAAKWVRHRCQEVPGRVAPMASTSPEWASEVTSPTGPAEVRPRATRSRKKANQPAWVSLVAVWIAEDLPVPLGVDAGGDHDRDLDDPAVLADLHHQGVDGDERCTGLASRGRVRNAATCSSRSLAISETWDFDSPVIPRVRTSLSIRRVETPSR